MEAFGGVMAKLTQDTLQNVKMTIKLVECMQFIPLPQIPLNSVRVIKHLVQKKQIEMRPRFQ